MKTNYLSRAFLFCAIIAATLFVGCEKDDVDTNDPGNGGTDTEEAEATDVPKMGDVAVVQGTLTKISATISHVLASTNGKITLSGLCWSTEENPDTTGLRKDQPATLSAGTYTTQLIGLAPGTVYYVRSYAENSKGLSYSPQFEFRTDGRDESQAVLPTISEVTLIGEVGKSAVSLSADITNDGNGTIMSSGFCWSTSPAPTIESSNILQKNPAPGVFTDRISGLMSQTKYYVRAFAQNIKGYVYSSDYEFTTTAIIESLMANAGTNFLVGSTAIAPLGTTPAIDAIFQNEYSAVQIPCYPTAWNSWPSKDVHDINGFNGWVDWAVANNRKVFGHFLVGHNTYNPKWLNEGTWTPEELDQMLEARVKALVEARKGKVELWMVVNEPLVNAKSTYRECIWTPMGTEKAVTDTKYGDNVIKDIPLYIVKACEYARKYDPNAKLGICDAAFALSVSTDLKGLAFQQLAEHLKKKGLLDAVGLQHHSPLGAAGMSDYMHQPRWDLLNWRIGSLKAFGLKVYITELTLGLDLSKAPRTYTEQEFADQGSVYEWFTKISCNPPATVEMNLPAPLHPVSLDQNAKADGIFYWGIGDGLDPAFRKNDQTSLYRADFTKKPAYFGVLKALSEAELE